MKRLLFVVAGFAAAMVGCQNPADQPVSSKKVATTDKGPGYPGGKIPVPKTADQLCGRFHGDELDFELELGEGVKLFPLYREVLEDPKRDGRSVRAVMSILWHLAQDEKLRPEVAKQFGGLTLRHLAGKDYMVHISALGLLRVIGGERDTAAVAPLLLAEMREARYAAAKTLAAIGGPRDVLVLDTVITNADRYRDAEGNRLLSAEYDVKDFEKFKAELEARLQKQDEEKAKK